MPFFGCCLIVCLKHPVMLRTCLVQGSRLTTVRAQGRFTVILSLWPFPMEKKITPTPFASRKKYRKKRVIVELAVIFQTFHTQKRILEFSHSFISSKIWKCWREQQGAWAAGRATGWKIFCNRSTVTTLACVINHECSLVSAWHAVQRRLKFGGNSWLLGNWCQAILMPGTAATHPTGILPLFPSPKCEGNLEASAAHSCPRSGSTEHMWW